MSETRDTVTACPDCDSAKSLYHRRTVDTWKCHECGAEFDEPIERESKGRTEPGRGSPLVDLDPEELP